MSDHEHKKINGGCGYFSSGGISPTLAPGEVYDAGYYVAPGQIIGRLPNNINNWSAYNYTLENDKLPVGTKQGLENYMFNSSSSTGGKRHHFWLVLLLILIFLGLVKIFIFKHTL